MADSQSIKPAANKSLVDYLILLLAFLGAMISLTSAFATGISQGRISGESIWPLPGLVLVIWGTLGLAGCLAVTGSLWQWPGKWAWAAWFASGALIPLIILGAFSIGPYVLISFALFLLAAILLGLTKRVGWLVGGSMLLLGGLANSGILWLILSLSGSR